jgi:hypothetical protein
MFVFYIKLLVQIYHQLLKENFGGFLLYHKFKTMPLKIESS